MGGLRRQTARCGLCRAPLGFPGNGGVKASDFAPLDRVEVFDSMFAEFTIGSLWVDRVSFADPPYCLDGLLAAL